MGRAAIKPLPSSEELHRLLAYDANTGALTWKYVRPGAHRIQVGGAAGTVTERGYLHVGIERRQYLAHRIIWKMMTGDDPVDQIDHIDGNRLNNGWSNLRAADNQRNLWNAKLRRDNTSGFKGVHERRGRYRAVIKLTGRFKHLGSFDTAEQAAEVWRRAAIKQRGELLRLS